MVVLPLIMDISLVCVGCVADNIVETAVVVKIIFLSSLDCVMLAVVVVLLPSNPGTFCVERRYVPLVSSVLPGIVLKTCDVGMFPFLCVKDPSKLLEDNVKFPTGLHELPLFLLQ